MAKAELGVKRTCLSCGMRYYDFNRTPILCAGCQAEFDPEAVVRSKRGRVVGKAVKATSKTATEADLETAEDDIIDGEVAGDEGAEVIEAVVEKAEDDFDDTDIDADNDDRAGLISDDLDEDDDILSGIPSSNDD